MKNIFNLYITRSNEERKYFYNIIDFLNKNVNVNCKNYVQIVYLDFKYNDIVKNIKLNNQPLNAKIFIYNKGLTIYNKIIYNLDDLINLYIIPQNNNKNIFIYTGHGNGMFLMKNKIRILRTEDFCEIIHKTVIKADLVVYDCCLQGNIACLNITYPVANYVLASTSYQSYISILMVPSLYNENNYKNICINLSKLELKLNDTYKTDFVIYEMNKSLLDLVSLTLKYKNYFDYKKSFVIDFNYYKDLKCCFADIGIDINPLLNNIVKYQRYNHSKCVNKKISKNANKAASSQLMIILKKTVKNGIKTQSDLFLQNYKEPNI